MLQAEFFGLPGLADKASAGLDADSSHGQGEGAAPSHAAPAACQYDSVYLETGFHPVKSEFNVLQQQQAATMEVTPRCILQGSSCGAYYKGHHAAWNDGMREGGCWSLHTCSVHSQRRICMASTVVPQQPHTAIHGERFFAVTAHFAV